MAAKSHNQSDFGIDHLLMSMCRVFSCVVGRGCFPLTSAFSGITLLQEGEGNGKPLQYSSLENHMNSMKRQKDRTLKDEFSRLVGAQHATGDQWRNNSRKNEEMEPKQKQYPGVDMTGDGSKSDAIKSHIV